MDNPANRSNICRIFLLRHAEPLFAGGVHVVLGQRTDPPLSPRGREQAEALRVLFEKIPLSSVSASPMRRCMETAQLIANGRWEVQCLAAAIEVDYGPWDAMSFDEIRRFWPELYEKRAADMSLLPPGAEPLAQAAERLEKALLSFPAGDHLLVAHAGINRALLCRTLGLPLRENGTIAQDYGAVNVIENRNGILCAPAYGLSAESAFHALRSQSGCQFPP